MCKKEVLPPRRTFCSDICSHEWRLRSDNRYLRDHVYERDLGKCASCGSDTRFQKIRVEDAGLEARKRSGTRWREDAVYAGFLRTEGLTVKEAEKSLWHADHVTEVADGGGECGIDGFQSLCIRCHKVKSAESRRRRAASRKAK